MKTWLVIFVVIAILYGIGFAISLKVGRDKGTGKQTPEIEEAAKNYGGD